MYRRVLPSGGKGLFTSFGCSTPEKQSGPIRRVFQPPERRQWLFAMSLPTLLGRGVQGKACLHLPPTAFSHKANNNRVISRDFLSSSRTSGSLELYFSMQYPFVILKMNIKGAGKPGCGFPAPFHSICFGVLCARYSYSAIVSPSAGIMTREAKPFSCTNWRMSFLPSRA